MSELHKEKKSLTSSRLLKGGLIAFVLLTIFVISLPWLVTHLSLGDLGVAEANEIGDTIGGIMGPTVGLIGAILTFFAFWAQYDANQEQKRQFYDSLAKQKMADQEMKNRYEIERDEQQAIFLNQQEQFQRNQQLQQEQILLQDKRTKLDLFETKYFSMLSIHRDNVNDMEVHQIAGRKAFWQLFNELRFIYWLMKNFYDANPTIANPNGNLTNEELYQAAYLSFFFGIGPNSTPLVQDLVGDRLESFILNAHKHITILVAKFNKLECDYSTKTATATITWRRDRTLGLGHMSRLSHYVRHLFQTVKFVDEQDQELLNNLEKYNYLSTLRAQLSTFEQLLLYYNAMSVLGEPWLMVHGNNSENYIQKYCMIKSIPLNGADFYINPETRFPTENNLGKPMFEWLEIRERVANL